MIVLAYPVCNLSLCDPSLRRIYVETGEFLSATRPRLTSPDVVNRLCALWLHPLVRSAVSTALCAGLSCLTRHAVVAFLSAAGPHLTIPDAANFLCAPWSYRDFRLVVAIFLSAARSHSGHPRPAIVPPAA